MRRERLLYRRKRVLLLLNLHRRQRRIWRIERQGGKVFWANVFENFDEVQWVHHFRMSRCTFQYILSLVVPALTRKTTQWRKPLEPRQRLAIALWWYATPGEYRTISCLFGVGISTVCVNVRVVTGALLLKLSKRFVAMLEGDQLQKTLDGFTARGYPMCAGAIDGTHIPVIAPKDDPNSYYNRKGWHSLVLQAVVDHNFW